MILYINTIDKTTKVKLYNGNVDLIDEISFEGSFILSEELVQRIDLLLKKNHFTKKDLTRLAVNSGPGSYTGLRIGVTTANSIAFALNIPIIEISNEANVGKMLKQNLSDKIFSSPVLPIYANSPHITKKK